MGAALAIEKGTLHVVVAYDVGLSVDLEQCRRSITDLTELATIRHKGVAPPFFQFDPLPVRVTQSIAPLAIGRFSSSAQVELVVYDFGGISVIYEVPIAGPVEELVGLSCDLAASALFREDSRARIEHLMTFIEPSVTRANIEELTEEYLIFQVSRFAGAPRPETLHADHGQVLARLLRAERDPLSEQEVAEALGARVSFGLSDVAIIDWNAALVYDAEPEDVISVLEFANLQLLELRYLDARLDLSLVYRAAAQRYRLGEWNAGIVRKLETIEDIYEKVHDHATEIRMEVLEWIIILLIALELLLPLLRPR
jgi:hypothetical protein